MRFKDKKEAEDYIDNLEYGEFEDYDNTSDIAEFYGVEMSNDFYAAYNVIENVYGDIVLDECDRVEMAERYRKMRMDPYGKKELAKEDKTANNEQKQKIKKEDSDNGDN